MITMLRSRLSGPQADPNSDEHSCLAVPLLGAGLGALRAYTAFCRNHSQVYQRYASAVIGDPVIGRLLAEAALQELGAQWPTALRSADPRTLGWVLLRAATASRRTATVRVLQQGLRPQEADALVLYYRLGLTADRAGCAMGVPAGVFDLLRHEALRKAARLDWAPHMPKGIAI
ncbi:hypothetical protein [Streptomyces sp. NPDC058451]|uniref:hypothetical protein n=1 Tax=Streptomyces sp. NPDC058451 TaxID=3346506 RepID=UPI0036497333